MSVEVIVLMCVLALMGIWALVLLRSSAGRMREAAAGLGAELGWPVTVEGFKASVVGRVEDAVVTGRLYYVHRDMRLDLEVDARDSGALAEIDRARVREILAVLRGFGVGGGRVQTTLDYPLADGLLRARIADCVYLARASKQLDGTAMMALDPRTSAFMRHVAEGAPVEEAVARVVAERDGR